MIITNECLMGYFPDGDYNEIDLISDKEYEITLRVKFKGAEDSNVFFEVVSNGSEVMIDSERIIKIEPARGE